MKHTSDLAFTRVSSLDLEDLLYPARAFANPRDVVSDPDLTVNEKRAILASWASDACAVEAAPALRRPPGLSDPVRVEDILEALRTLDKQAQNGTAPPQGWVRRQIRRSSLEAFRVRRNRGGQSLDSGSTH